MHVVRAQGGHVRRGEAGPNPNLAITGELHPAPYPNGCGKLGSNDRINVHRLASKHWEEIKPAAMRFIVRCVMVTLTGVQYIPLP